MAETPLRADARRNRQRVLEVADEVFAEGGDAASTEEVARRAGVGVGTVFRHFPTKAELLEAVFVARLERLADEARARCGTGDPGTAFADFFSHVVRDAPGKLSIAGALADEGVDVHQTVAGAHGRLHEAFGELLTGAQRAGTIRDDVGTAEVYALMVGVSRAVTYSRLDPAVTDATLRIALDGLRAR